MRVLIALALLLSLLVTIFAAQNNEPTDIQFLFWEVGGSLALVLMITLVLGIVIGVLLMIPASVRNRLQVGELKRSVRSIEEEQAAETESPVDQPLED